MTKKSTIYWLTPDRFDTKRDKSSWVEMGKAFIDMGYRTTILTCQSKKNVLANDDNNFMAYVSAIDFPFIFRFSAIIQMFLWLKKRAEKDDVIIINQDALLIVPLLNFIGLRKIHLDIRTIPVDVRTFKKHLDEFLYWYIPLRFFGRSVVSYSFITERLREEVEKQFNFNIKSYVIWQSGVNTTLFRPINPVKQNPNKQFCLFYHGTITINRGINLIIEAISMMKENIEFNFTIVGDGSGTAELKALAKKLGVSEHIQFKGLIPYEEMVNEISQADMCICPLTDRLEWNVSSPIKVFEYMACGKPIILTPISAHKDVADEQNYIVWTNGCKAIDFKEAIHLAIENKIELQRLAKKAPLYVSNHFQWKNLATKLEKHLCKTIPNIN